MVTGGDQGQYGHGGSDARPGPAPQARRALIVAGPTASGKSALAIDLARAWGGVVINADSMQIYRELRIVTARPSLAEEAAVPHRLYGVLPAATAGSVAWWREQALAAMEEAWGRGLIPILCGGTGLYFATLTGGLADIPDPGATARAEARALLAEHGAAWLHAHLAAADPDSAAKLRPSDGQRIARAWEVWRGTGQGMAAWHAQAAQTRSDCQFAAILLDPERGQLREAVAQRFAAMVDLGALDEIRALLSLGLDPALPAMRALGVAELALHLSGELTLADAIARAVLATGRYTKRQTTWFHHHELAAPELVHTIHARYTGLTQLSERNMASLSHFLKNTVDARQHTQLLLRT